MAEHNKRLVENGGYINLNRHWAYGFLELYRGSQPLQKVSCFAVKKEILHDLVTTDKIPPEVDFKLKKILTKISSSWTM